jgi:hypothetical protein
VALLVSMQATAFGTDWRSRTRLGGCASEHACGDRDRKPDADPSMSQAAKPRLELDGARPLRRRLVPRSSRARLPECVT